MNRSQRLADRFKPSLPERMKQSADAKARKKSPEVRAQKPKKEDTYRQLRRTVRTIGSSLLTSTTTQYCDPWEGWMTNLNNGTTVQIWTGWAATTSGSTITYSVWDDWQTMPYSSHRNRFANDPPLFRTQERYEVQESEEMKKARLEREARYQAEQEAYRVRREQEAKALELASKRARELLLSCLSAEQKACLEKNRYFYVTAKSGRRYRIDEGTHGNVKVVDRDGRVIERLCIQPNGVPVGDSMLAQKLLIETQEDAFRRHANITLNNGQVIMGDAALLDGDKMGQIIPFRRAA